MSVFLAVLLTLIASGDSVSAMQEQEDNMDNVLTAHKHPLCLPDLQHLTHFNLAPSLIFV